MPVRAPDPKPAGGARSSKELPGWPPMARVDADAAWTWHRSLSRLRMNDVFKHSNSESLAGLHRLQERMEQTRRSDTWLAALVRVVAMVTRTGMAITAAVGIPVVVGTKWSLARSGCFSRRRDVPVYSCGAACALLSGHRAALQRSHPKWAWTASSMQQCFKLRSRTMSKSWRRWPEQPSNVFCAGKKKQ